MIEVFVEEVIREIRVKVGDKWVLLVLFGGVDFLILVFLFY